MSRSPCTARYYLNRVSCSKSIDLLCDGSPAAIAIISAFDHERRVWLRGFCGYALKSSFQPVAKLETAFMKIVEAFLCLSVTCKQRLTPHPYISGVRVGGTTSKLADYRCTGRHWG